MKNLLWALFRETGKVEYYLKYKEIEKSEVNEKSGSRKNL